MWKVRSLVMMMMMLLLLIQTCREKGMSLIPIGMIVQHGHGKGINADIQCTAFVAVELFHSLRCWPGFLQEDKEAKEEVSLLRLQLLDDNSDCLAHVERLRRRCLGGYVRLYRCATGHVHCARRMRMIAMENSLLNITRYQRFGQCSEQV